MKITLTTKKYFSNTAPLMRVVFKAMNTSYMFTRFELIKLFK